MLTKDTINPAIINAQYAVRGELAIKAEKYRSQLDNNESLPFKQVINANIGNPQQLDQKPLTFIRQVIALCEYPTLLDSDLFPADAKKRAKEILKSGSVGAYSGSQGIPYIRKHVAEYISKRDGFEASPDDIFLTSGASQGAGYFVQLLSGVENAGILIPTPQYPLYTATLALNSATPVKYYTDESSGWSTPLSELKRAYDEAQKNKINVRGCVIINPGNPTGACLERKDLEEIIYFCHDHDLVLLADEVYQTNVYIHPFVSFKKVLREIQKEKSDFKLELWSLHSTSKGMIGECGRRGGYFELIGFDKDVVAQIYKMASINLCSAVSGQIAVDLMVSPPQPGDESYDLYKKEYDHTFNTLKERSQKLYNAFNEMKNVSCQEPQGAMYLFPSVKLPKKAVEKAKEEGKSPDEYYCLRLLDETGVCCVPGKGFGQKEDTYHFRTTFLAPGTDYADTMTKFNNAFMDEFE